MQYTHYRCGIRYLQAMGVGILVERGKRELVMNEKSEEKKEKKEEKKKKINMGIK